jgi:hypothetical protein
MITAALRVEIRRLLPQLVGELVIAQPEVATLCVVRIEERAAVEDRQWPHAGQPTFPETLLSFQSAPGMSRSRHREMVRHIRLSVRR